MPRSHARLNRRADRRSRRGITLVEVLIVSVVFVIVAAAVINNSSPEIAEHLRGAGETVAADLAYVRGLAVANNSKYRVTFDLTKNEYYLEHTGANSALNVLPAGPFGRGDDPPTRRTVRLADLADFGARVRLETVTAGTTAVAHVEFGPFGQTVQTETTTVWLTAGNGGEKRFAPLAIQPVTGLATPGKVQAAAPGGGAGSGVGSGGVGVGSGVGSGGS